MPIHRLNHAVLYVSNVARSVDFYVGTLDFRVVLSLGAGAAFLQAQASTNDHDLGLFEVGASAGSSTAGRDQVGLYHLAWEVHTLTELSEMAERLSRAGFLVGATDHSITKSLYGRDPDGLEFEIEWRVPTPLLTPELLDRARRPVPLDLDGEIARYGATTIGATGITSAPDLQEPSENTNYTAAQKN